MTWADLGVFGAAFAGAFLGCLQSINVNRGKHGWAAITSMAISLTHLILYKTIPQVDYSSAAVFVAGGVLGSQVSMFVHRKPR